MTTKSAPTSVGRRRSVAGAASPSLIITVIVLAIVMLIPLAYVLFVVVQVGLSDLGDMVFRPRVGELLVNTVLVVVISVPVTIVLGVGGAWLVERTTLPAGRFFAVMLAAPLAIPAFVTSYGWGSTAHGLSGLGGGLLISILAYYPLVYLPVLAGIRGLDPALEESGRSMGLGEWAVFARIVLPQLRLAILGGALIVGLHLLAEYGAFAFIRFDTFTTAIVVAYESAFAGPAAASLGVVLATLCLVLLVSESSLRGRGRYSRLGSGAPRPPMRVSLGWTTAPVVALLAVLGAAAVGVPVVSVVRWIGFADASAYAALPATLINTVSLSIGGAVLALLLALPVAWLSARHPGRFARQLEGTYYVASSFPTIIIALALVTASLAFAPSLYQTGFTVMIAYALTFMPRALVPLRAGIAQAPESLEEAARSLGVSPLISRIRVTLPRLMPSIAAGAALVALGAANELTATLLLAPTGTRTLATQFWAATSAVDYPSAAPFALTLILLSIPAVALLFGQTRGHRIR